jgi:hypothetical protein
VGGVGIIKYKQNVDCFQSRPSLAGFVIILDKSQQRQLIEQSQKFANKYGFKFDIAYYTPHGDDFLIDMTRKDVEIVIGNTIDLEKFYVNFYNYDCVHPTVASDLDGLVNDLKGFIKEIPYVTITEEK